MALTAYDGCGDFVFSEAATLAAFLLGMGLGTLWLDRRKRPSWTSLFYVECIQAVIGAFSVMYVQFCEFVWRYFFPSSVEAIFFFLLLPAVFVLGLLNGCELPLLLRLNAKTPASRILAANYFGALVAAFMVPVVLLPLVDVDGLAVILSGIGLWIAAGTLVFVAKGWRENLIALAALSSVLAMGFARPTWKDVHLKMAYWHPRFSNLNLVKRDLEMFERLNTPRRLRSRYQWIDMIDPNFSQAIQGRNGFLLFLNRHLQFSSTNFHRYHESMVHGSVNLLSSPPKSALILGGGDGLLLPELFRYPSLKSADLVELDSRMIDLAKHEPEFLRLNEGSLSDPRVHVHLEDAFHFVKSSQGLYDLILIDLPYPDNYDLSLLFTREFYALVKRRLRPGGILTLDFPAPESAARAYEILLHTLKAAGFDNLWGFGTEENFVVAQNGTRPMHFDFSRLGPRVSDQTLTNLLSREDDVRRALLQPSPVNTIFSPIRFDRLENKP